MSRHGATYLGEGRGRFAVWAPRARTVELVLEGDEPYREPLVALEGGYFAAVVHGVSPGTRYRYLLDGDGPFADPASRAQPEGVHGPSALTGALPHLDAHWRGVPLSAQVICELHVGTFSAAGTFDGVAERCDALAAAGYSAIELMPIGEFPGTRNWGYDGVFPFAPASCYGGGDGLGRLVHAAHGAGLAVLVDAIYNHLGPEGRVHEQFGPYFTDRYATPWGPALNFDGPDSDGVRAYFIEHACHLVADFGVDGLRLDAIHAIADTSASPFVAELVAALRAEGRRLGRTVTVVAESSANDPRTTTPVELGGIGCDGWWDDDFHHALAVTLTGRRDRYFADYGGIADLEVAYRRGVVVAGRHSVVHGRHHGAPSPGPVHGERFVAYAQNHDQVGTGGGGERLARTLGLVAQFPIAAAVLLSPFVPLRFMGEEYGELAPFHFFTDHEDEAVAEATRSGRQAELGALGLVVPDPQQVATFAACRLDPTLAASGLHAELLAWQRELLALRAREPALGTLEPELTETWSDADSATLIVLRRANRHLDAPAIAVILRLGDGEVSLTAPPLRGAHLEVLAVANVAGLLRGDELGAALHLPGFAAIVARLSAHTDTAPVPLAGESTPVKRTR